MPNDISAPESSSPGLAAFVDSFESLTIQEKATALQYFRQRKEIPPSPQPGAAIAHSCSFCERFVFEDARDPWAFDSSSVYPETLWHPVSKEILTQGFARRCLLAEWIMTLLSRGLIEFKSVMTRKGLNLPPRGSSDDIKIVTDDLEYLGANLHVRLQIYEKESRCTIFVECNTDLALVDKLWEASSDIHMTIAYQDFVRRYTPTLTARLRVYADPSDVAALHISATRPTEPVFDSDAFLDLARNWVRECHETHDNCLKRCGDLPSRVVDIGTKFPIQSIRLYWTADGEAGRYAALTYCWGGPQPFTTTFATAQDFTDGMLFADFPKTIQDAMVMTYHLGLRFLWVDSLCIIQDDPEDVAREISKMAQIYQEAFVTISAASARSVREGFLGPRRSAGEPAVKLPYKVQSSTGSVMVERPQVYSRQEDPIHLRAWTLQEHILSQKLLLCGSRTLVWACESATYHDRDPTASSDQSYDIRGVPGAKGSSLDRWRSLVRDYTHRFMTDPHDKLPAIAGIAAEYSKIFGDTYLAGLWEFALVSELMWCSVRSDISRPLAQRAPSWSWASVDGGIHHKWCPVDLRSGGLRCLDYHVTPISMSSRFGRVDPTRSFLRVEGEMARVYWQQSRDYIYAADHVTYIGRGQPDSSETMPTEGGVTVIWALAITRNPLRGLLLLNVDGNTFRRVGIFFRIWDTRYCYFETRTITIV